MTFAGIRDVGALANAGKLHLASIAFGDNGTPQNGGSVDTHPVLGDVRMQALRSAQLHIFVDATLTVANTLDLTVNLQDAPDNGSDAPGTFADVPAGTLLDTIHGGTGDLTAFALDQILQAAPVQEFSLGPIDLTRLDRHVRVQVTPTFSNAADTALIAAFLVVGGSALRQVDTLVG